MEDEAIPAMPQRPSNDVICQALTTGFGWTPTALRAIPIGERSCNYEAHLVDGARAFVKVTPRLERLDVPTVVALNAMMHSAGVATSQAMRARNHSFLYETADWTFSVWSWLDGRVRTEPWDERSASLAGQTLAKIHTTLANKIPEHIQALPLHKWLNEEVLRGFIAADGASAWALSRYAHVVREADRKYYSDVLDHIQWRRRFLDSLKDGIEIKTRSLHQQVIHGDYSILNILFDGVDPIMITDFSPMAVGTTEYELGRIAFTPQFVALSDSQWYLGAQQLVKAYCSHTGADEVETFQRSVIAFAVHLASNYYGMKAHLEDSINCTELEIFWWQRACTLKELSKHLFAWSI